jgi:hypothetical protein
MEGMLAANKLIVFDDIVAPAAGTSYPCLSFTHNASRRTSDRGSDRHTNTFEL